MRTPTKKTIAFAWITKRLIEDGSIGIDEIKERYDIADRTWREWRLTMERFLELDIREDEGRIWLETYDWKPGEPFEPARMSRDHLIEYARAHTPRKSRDTYITQMLDFLKGVHPFQNRGDR